MFGGYKIQIKNNKKKPILIYKTKQPTFQIFFKGVKSKSKNKIKNNLIFEEFVFRVRNKTSYNINDKLEFKSKLIYIYIYPIHVFMLPNRSENCVTYWLVRKKINSQRDNIPTI
jgi:hypothetical protein